MLLSWWAWCITVAFGPWGFEMTCNGRTDPASPGAFSRHNRFHNGDFRRERAGTQLPLQLKKAGHLAFDAQKQAMQHKA